MNPEQLLSHFNRISEAPDAIPRLRQFILELAVRGKLVEQDPRDKPASDLINHIQAEKDRRPNKGHIKEQEPLLNVGSDEAWFVIPLGWCWVRLGEITQIVMGQSPPGATYNKTGEGIPLINGPVEFTKGPFGKTCVNQYTTAPTNLCEEGDLLLCVRGSTTGRTNIAGFRACIGRGVAAIRPIFADHYVRLFIWRLRASIIAMGRGIAFPSVSRKQIEELPVPLPPLAEQYRIVAKVDELMALCDRLEAAQAERESRRDRLASASLQRLNQPTGEPAFREHARFHLRHLPRFTTRPEHIQQLRQTILNLAVRGQLVSQDPNDESVSELINRIQAGNVHSVKAKDKPTLSPTIDSGAIPYPIPKHWAWLQLDQIGVLSGGMTPSKNRPDFWEGDINWFSPKDIKSDELVDSELKITLAGVTETRLQLYQPGCLFLVARSGILKRTLPVAINRVESAVNQDLKVLTPFLRGMERYLQIMFRGMTEFILTALVKTGTTVQSLKYAEFERQLFPLPPLAEQHRIVEKVDELMVVCDQLETQLTTAQTESRRLLEALLHGALALAV